jgi:hypothetical protein
MKQIFSSILIIIGYLFLYPTVHAQSYVQDWPVESLKPSAETLRQLEHQNDDIPYYLQNRTFRDTIYDTISWETIEDIDYVFFKALGTENSSYSLDIEILDNGDFLVPWYNDTSFFITRLDSIGEEIYTNHYSNIDRASVDCYRDGQYVYMAGRINMDTAEFHQNHIALIKYDLETDDTAFVRIVAACEYQVHYYHSSHFQNDSVFYVSSSISNLTKYIYEFNKKAELKIKISKGDIKIGSIFELRDTIFILDNFSNLFYISNDSIDFVKRIGDSRHHCIYVSEDIFTYDFKIRKFDLDFNYKSTFISNNPGFASSAFQVFDEDKTKNLLISGGVSTSNWWPPGEDYSIGLYKISGYDQWLHKLYIGGANFDDQRVIILPNGDYLFIARAWENPTGNGTIFFMRMKPWQDNVGITDLPIKKTVTTYPNPANEEIFIKTTEITGIVGINIYDLTGRKVNSRNQNISEPINISTLQNGLYSIVITSNSNLYYSKFIKH